MSRNGGHQRSLRSIECGERILNVSTEQAAQDSRSPLKEREATLLVREFLLSVAGHGLSHTTPRVPFSVPESVFDEFLGGLTTERLVGAAAEAYTDRALVLTSSQFDSLNRLHKDWLQQAVGVERLLIRFAELLRAEGIPFRSLKGVALAQVVYRDPAWRVFADLDVLVAADRLDEAVQLALRQLGGHRAEPEIRPGFDSEFAKDVLVHVDQIELDLHRTLISGPFGFTIGLDDVFAGSAPHRVGDVEVPALDAVSMFMHACYNAALGDYPPRLSGLRDLALVAVHLQIDRDVVADVARRWRATAVVRQAAEITVRELGLHASHPLSGLINLEVRRGQRLLLRSYETPARSYTRPLASAIVMRGVRPRWKFVRALVTPSREYLASRGWSLRSHAARARDRLLGRG